MPEAPSACSRRAFFRQAIAAGACSILGASPGRTGVVGDEAAVLEKISAARPLRGGSIPADLARRLGTAHVSGRYHLTSEPFLLEGARRVQALGLGGLKLWFDRMERGYRFNSDWKLPANATLVERARHPYYAAAFALPFSVIALELYSAPGTNQPAVSGHMISPRSDFARDEQQVYELALHLLRTYRDRDLTFLLQNWEGDWMFRGGTQTEWTRLQHPDLDARVAAFTHWFEARQRGVERARAELGDTRCRVFHAVEVNRVFDELAGIPTVTTHVLPHIRPDYISWSCYDGLKTAEGRGEATGLGLWQGLDLIQRHARTTQQDSAGRPAVYIGEMGFPEQVIPAGAVVDMMDGAMGTLLAREIPYVFHWQLYCNERKDGASYAPVEAEEADELRGFWLVRPEGTLSHTAEYFRKILAHSGGALPRSSR